MEVPSWPLVPLQNCWLSYRVSKQWSFIPFWKSWRNECVDEVDEANLLSCSDSEQWFCNQKQICFFSGLYASIWFHTDMYSISSCFHWKSYWQCLPPLVPVCRFFEEIMLNQLVYFSNLMVCSPNLLIIPSVWITFYFVSYWSGKFETVNILPVEPQWQSIL